jgi:hypothetical protein
VFEAENTFSGIPDRGRGHNVARVTVRHNWQGRAVAGCDVGHAMARAVFPGKAPRLRAEDLGRPRR